ncbi:hypothetical protein [Bradyrhizobium centrolobii]|nr:hypothetical protein [Bradyrhizobium centrolobii]
MLDRKLLLLVFLVSQSTGASGQSSSSPAPATTSILIPIVAALIGSAFAIAGILLKELFIFRANAQLARAETQKDIVRSYMAPLTSGCEKLIWRFKELFIDNRHQWLMSNTLPISYNEHKRVSTLYRIATLLGWIRAINLELNSLEQGTSRFTGPLARAIGSFQSALADGPHTELRRLEQLCASWNIDIKELSLVQKQSLAVDLEVEYYKVAGSRLKEDPDYLLDLSDSKKLECCTALANFLTGKLRIKSLSPDFIKERVQSALESLAYEESLIYREWQEAIGDAMLVSEQGSIRKFRIIGYADFTKLLRTRSPWISAFRTSIDDINFAVIDKRDVRRQQLGRLARAVADMLGAIAETDDKDLVNHEALTVAKQLQEASDLHCT